MTEGDKTFRGFLVQAQDQSGETIGNFIVQDSTTQQLLDCSLANQAVGVCLSCNYFYSICEKCR